MLVINTADINLVYSIPVFICLHAFNSNISHGLVCTVRPRKKETRKSG